MRGRITYITTSTITPMMSPLVAMDIFSLPDVFAELLTAGQMQDINMYWGYATLDPYHSDQRNVSKSASGVVEITNFISTKGYKFDIEYVNQNRGSITDEYAVMQALNDELMMGTPVMWYPDYDYSITEYFSCVANSRLDAKRDGALLLWTFSFDLMVLASVQIPSTVPEFVWG
jgi:hypothetical protein